MRSDAKLVSPLAALTSAALHALLLASGLVLSAHASREERPLAPDSWAARSVEVGTVPDSAPKTEAEGEPPTPTRAAPTGTPSPVQTPARQQTRRVPKRVATERTVLPHEEPAASLPHARDSNAPAASAAARDGAENAGTIGAAGLPPGVRHLATAFTRALPAGGYKDAAWSELPLGRVGDALVRLQVTETGRLERVDVDPERGLSPALDHMIQRVVLLLKSGSFSLDPRKVSAGGAEHLEVEVTLSTRPANPDDLAAPGDLFSQSFAPPTPDRAGYARFTLNSGRHVEAIVRLAKRSPGRE